jgi:hypothetical protein
VCAELVANAYDPGTRPHQIRLRHTALCCVHIEVDDASHDLTVIGRSCPGGLLRPCELAPRLPLASTPLDLTAAIGCSGAVDMPDNSSASN